MRREITAGRTLTRQPKGGLERIAMAAATVLVGAVLVSTIGAARAAMYKWVDEKGVVHYSDKMPPEAVDKASTELSKQGVTVNKTDKVLTPEQRRAKELEAEKTKDAAKAQEEVARRDRALVASYTSEAEIDLARNRALQTINNVILSSQAFSEQLNKRKSDIEAKRAESKGKPGSAVLDRELESIDAELQRQSELVVQKNKEAAAITAKYEADKQRWRELSATKSATAAVPTKAMTNGAAPVVPTGTAKK